MPRLSRAELAILTLRHAIAGESVAILSARLRYYIYASCNANDFRYFNRALIGKQYA